MKKFIFSSFLLVLTYSINAQVKSSQVSENWILTDLVNPKISTIEIIKTDISDTIKFDADVIVNGSGLDIAHDEKGKEFHVMLAKGKIAYKLGIFDNSIQGATGLPNSKLNISANKDGFHYADKVWYPTSSENAIIICLKDKILGYNVKFENEKAKILEIVIFGHLHSGPSETSLVIGKVVVGTKVTQIDFSDDWYKVQLSNKQSGWIYKSLVKIEK